MTITELSEQAYKNAKKKGFYDGNPSFGALLMQVVEELGEASDADRRGKRCTETKPDEWIELVQKGECGTVVYEIDIKDTVESELADAFIILAGICKSRNIDIDAHIQAKMRYNSTRERLHGKEY